MKRSARCDASFIYRKFIDNFLSKKKSSTEPEPDELPGAVEVDTVYASERSTSREADHLLPSLLQVENVHAST